MEPRLGSLPIQGHPHIPKKPGLGRPSVAVQVVPVLAGYTNHDGNGHDHDRAIDDAYVRRRYHYHYHNHYQTRARRVLSASHLDSNFGSFLTFMPGSLTF
jgi:hypothetical protein